MRYNYFNDGNSGLTVNEIAELTKISRATLYRVIRQKEGQK
jgi:predicted DNA-binding transcriptional regulator AlpA